MRRDAFSQDGLVRSVGYVQDSWVPPFYNITVPITLPNPSAKCQHYLEDGASISFAVKKKKRGVQDFNFSREERGRKRGKSLDLGRKGRAEHRTALLRFDRKAP